MNDTSEIKCPKCGFINFKDSVKCGKCGFNLKKTKSCPRCAKKNSLNAQKCDKCGYRFKSNKRLIFNNLVISIIIVLVLGGLALLEMTGVIKGINIGLKVLAILFILLILYKTFNYGEKDIVDYSKNVDIKIDKKRYLKMKKISTISIIIGIIVVAIILICFFVIK